MRILVCGSRTWTDGGRIAENLLRLVVNQSVPLCTVIHGGARGADMLAGVAALKLGLDMRVFPADWKRYGRAAGAIRNQQMLDEGKPDIVLAFWDGKSRGTMDMVNRARKAHVEVRLVTEEPTRGGSEDRR